MVATIVVVGNGPSVGRCGLGAQIDQFDEVVRFNRFVTDGFAPHCGTKTTIWVRNNITPPTARTGEFQRWVSCPPRHRYRHAPLPHEFEIPQDVVTDVLQSLAGPWPRTKCPSAGLITLAYLTTRYPQISVVGFDGFDPRFARRALHYYRDGYRRINASCHSSPYEQGCLQRWVRAHRRVAT